ncbi:MAG TPA: L,D-transpeptidase family protein [Candidatus Dormibacteraeota bacterium]
MRLLVWALVGSLLAALLAAGGLSPRPAHAYTSTAGRYQPLPTPVRLLDTRTGTGGYGRLAPGQQIDVVVAGAAGVPPAGTVAAVLSVTATDTSDQGFLSVWPAGEARPTASNLNWGPGSTVANLVQVGIGASGEVSFYNNNSSTQVIVDVEGYYTSAPGASGRFRPLMPARILDTRSGLGGYGGPLGSGSTIRVAVAGAGDVPASASAAVINLTVTNPTTTSYLAVFPYAAGNSGVSNLNFRAGETRAVRALVGLDSSGSIGIYNSNGNAQVLVDVAGYFTNDADPAAAGGLFVAIQPVRVLDTRSGVGHAGAVGGAQRLDVALGGAGTPADASAAVLNLTATDASAPSFVVTYPSGNARVLASDVNFAPGFPTPNLAITPLGGGAFTLYNSQGATNVLADLVGYYQSAPSLGAKPPAPPTFSATSGDRSASLAWSAPSSPTTIVSYTIQRGDGFDLTVPASQTAASWPGLVNQATYTFSVVALNASGSGAATSVASVTPLGTPDPVTGLAVTPAPGMVTVNFSPPANNGGFPLLGYLIDISPSGQRIATQSTSVQIGGLPPVSYTFTVSAVNSYGTGPGLTSAPVNLGFHRIVVSLGDQTLYAYEGGVLKLQTYVATGRPALPTPPGDYHIFYKSSPYHMVSPWPPWSPYYYDPVDMDYAMEFIPGGYFLHDAWWRSWYGPGANLYDGTHGCVNVPHDAMAWLYSWAQVGDEVVVQP